MLRSPLGARDPAAGLPLTTFVTYYKTTTQQTTPAHYLLPPHNQYSRPAGRASSLLLPFRGRASEHCFILRAARATVIMKIPGD